METTNRFGMRRALTAIVATAVVASAAPSPARAAKVVRVETKEYQSPAVAVMPLHPTGAAVCNEGGALPRERGCVVFPAALCPGALPRGRGTRRLGAAGAGVPRLGRRPSEWIAFCGSTKRPLRTLGGTATVWLYPYRWPNLPACPGTATTGSVTATFLARR